MWLALEPDLMVVGEAADGAEVGGLIDSVEPDVVLMDVEMPGVDGVDATAAVHALRPALPVVILSLHDDIETRARAWVAGAAAFVAKHEVEPVLVRTIRDVVRWHRQQLSQPHSQSESQPQAPPGPLSDLRP